MARKDIFEQASYAQEGEDMVLGRLFESRLQHGGTYVDVGAHHPRRFSNTKLLYDRGWSGLNVDASREAIALFERERPRDINIWTGVGQENGSAIFYVFNEPALNTFDRERAQIIEAKDRRFRVVEEREVSVTTLAALLDRHLGDRDIDVLLVDVEGRDLAVLKSNNWRNYCPQYVVVEKLDCRTIRDADQSDVSLYLQGEGYQFFAKTVNSLFFVHD